MNEAIKQRVAFALKCKPEEVPEDPKKLREALDKRRNQLKEAKYGKSVH